MLGVRRLDEEGMPLSSFLWTTTLDTLKFGDGRSPCDRDRCSDLRLTRLSSMSKSSITVSLKNKNMLQLTRTFVDSWRLI